MKIYSYETPLYGALNRANQCQDESAIKTLGPFSLLLYKTLRKPPKQNREVQGEKTHEGKPRYKGDKNQRITLYRGLGLPKDAISVYHEYLKKYKALTEDSTFDEE